MVSILPLSLEPHLCSLRRRKPSGAGDCWSVRKKCSRGHPESPADRLNPIANRPPAALRTFVRGNARGRPPEGVPGAGGLASRAPVLCRPQRTTYRNARLQAHNSASCFRGLGVAPKVNAALRYCKARRCNTYTSTSIGPRTPHSQQDELARAAGSSAHKGAQGGRRPVSDRVQPVGRSRTSLCSV